MTTTPFPDCHFTSHISYNGATHGCRRAPGVTRWCTQATRVRVNGEDKPPGAGLAAKGANHRHRQVAKGADELPRVQLMATSEPPSAWASLRGYGWRARTCRRGHGWRARACRRGHGSRARACCRGHGSRARASYQWCGTQEHESKKEILAAKMWEQS